MEPPAAAVPPAEAFAPLLTESLNGFAVLDASGRYAFASASLCDLLSLPKDALLGHPAAELVIQADRVALCALLEEARRAFAQQRRCESFALVRHACASGWQPVEVKACTDGEFTFCVLLDARVPTCLESSLPQFLLSTSHDLRTPCCSIQTATALLLSLPAVAADGEACGLLCTVDASCAALLRCVINVLQMRQLQRAGPLGLQLPPPRVFDPLACVRRVFNMANALDCMHQRLTWESQPTPALPTRVLGDESSLSACLENLLLTALLWLPQDAPVQLLVSAEAVHEAAAHVEMHVAMQRAPSAAGDFTLVISAVTPGRPLTPHEVASVLTPFSMLPADKGGGTGLGLYVTHGLARAMGGQLEVQPGLSEGTLLRLRVPLRVADAADVPAFAAELARVARSDATRFLTEPPPVVLATPPLKRRPLSDAPRDPASELPLTSRMFECLMANSDDVFALCRIIKVEDEAGTAPRVAAMIEYISPFVAWRMGVSQADAMGRDMLGMCHPEDHRALQDAVRAAYDGTGSRGYRIRYVHRSITADGSTIWCNSSGLCKGDQLLLVCRDMRTIRSVELALRTFTLAISHDLREPCNAILVAAAVLERRACVATAAGAEAVAGNNASSTSASSGPPLDAQALVACIRSACSLLLGILGNVLSAPQVETGELSLQCAVFSPARLVADVLQACRMGCAAGAEGGTGIELESTCGTGDESLPPMVEADRDRIAQVLQNLTTNACKFSSGAPVHTHASVQRGADGSASLVLAVTDAGRGMTQQEAAACFTAGQAAAPDFGGGTGLGLYISNAFARLMGGSLTVQSEPGKGSTFELRVPVRILPPEEAAEAAEAAAEVMTGEAGAAAAAAAAAEAAEAQRNRTASASTAAAAPVVTASRVAAPCSPPATPTRHRFHVLIADDHQLNLRLFTRLLQMHDFLVTAVADGGAALSALQASFAPPPPGAAAAQPPQPPPFDVAVLDMDMPVLRGTQVAAAFRTFEAGVRPSASMRLPIFALTANVLEEHAAECIQAGMDSFLAKPLRAADVALLRAHAAAYAEHRALEAETAAAAAQIAPHETQAALEAAAMRTAEAHAVLGLHAVAEQQRRNSAQAGGSATPVSSPRCGDRQYSG